MNTVELELIGFTHICLRDRFLGTFAANKIPPIANIRQLKHDSCMICNTDPDYKTGSHWVAFYVNKNGVIEFFDSLNNDVDSYVHGIRDILYDDSLHIISNKLQYQSNTSIKCGEFVLFYLDLRCQGFTFDAILDKFHSENLPYNDKLVDTYYNKHFILK